MLNTIHDWSKCNNRGWETKVLKLSNKLNVAEINNDQYMSIRSDLETVRTILSNKDNEIWNHDSQNSENNILSFFRKGMILFFIIIKGRPSRFI